MAGFFKLMDLFGYIPSFTIAKHSSFQTNFGAFVSLLVSFAIIYTVWYFGSELLYKLKPSLIVTTYNDEMPLRINLTEENNFMVTLGLQNPDYSLYINESIYYLEAKHIIMTRNGKGETLVESTIIQMERCSHMNITILPEYFHLMDLPNLYCIKNSSDLYIEGEFGRSKWAYLEFTFHRCSNSTLNSNCKSHEEISRRLDGGYYGMFITDTNINPGNYSFPKQTYGKNLYTTFSIRAYRDFWMSMKTLQLNTDSGWLMDDWENKNFFSMDFIRETWDFRDTSDIFFSYMIRCSPSRQVIDRSYIKIQSIAANVGGLIKFLLLAGKIIVIYFRMMYFKSYMVTFITDHVSNTRNSAEKSSSINFMPRPQMDIYFKDRRQELTLKNPSSAIQEKSIISLRGYPERKQKAAYISLSTADILNCWTKKGRGKILELNKLYKDISINLDFITMLKLHSDHELIKSMLFTEQELNILDIGYKFHNHSPLMKRFFDCRFNLELLDQNEKRICKESYFYLLRNQSGTKSKKILDMIDSRTQEFMQDKQIILC